MNEKNGYVELRNINKSYGDFQASKDINISISRGKLAALLGPSGSGKTTILRMIAGLEHPDTGQILIDGKIVNDVPGSERGIGFVFQSYALFRYMTVFENIAFGLRVKKAPEEKIRERVAELLKLIGCEGLEKRYPSQLSGGQRQRVAFARALAPDPQILLLDEPTSNLDVYHQLHVMKMLRDIAHKKQIIVVVICHDLNIASKYADQILMMKDGTIFASGTSGEVITKENIESVYDVKCKIIDDEGRPHVILQDGSL
jgi:sulfate transport system ATP-binding protein